jgi:predicted phage terminase large subunit-like protein
MRCATNPGGPGHSWVKRRFIDPKTRAHDTFFLPAFAEDNPGIDLHSYERSLSQMSYLNYERMRKGNWEIEETGNYFHRDWFVYLDLDRVPAEMDAVVRYWDLASAKVGADNRKRDWTVGALIGLKDGVYYLLDIVRMQSTPAEVEKIIASTAYRDGRGVMVFMEQEPGSQGDHLISYYQLNILFGYNFRGHRATGPKEKRADPVSALVMQGNLRVLNARWTSELVDEMVAFPTGFHDDQVDAVSGAVEMLAIYGRKPRGRRGVTQ